MTPAPLHRAGPCRPGAASYPDVASAARFARCGPAYRPAPGRHGPALFTPPRLHPDRARRRHGLSAVLLVHRAVRRPHDQPPRPAGARRRGQPAAGPAAAVGPGQRRRAAGRRPRPDPGRVRVARPATLEPTHTPTLVTYALRPVGDRLWLVRQQSPLDTLAEGGTSADLAAGGVARFTVDAPPTAADRAAATQPADAGPDARRSNAWPASARCPAGAGHGHLRRPRPTARGRGGVPVTTRPEPSRPNAGDTVHADGPFSPGRTRPGLTSAGQRACVAGGRPFACHINPGRVRPGPKWGFRAGHAARLGASPSSADRWVRPARRPAPPDRRRGVARRRLPAHAPADDDATGGRARFAAAVGVGVDPVHGPGRRRERPGVGRGGRRPAAPPVATLHETVLLGDVRFDVRLCDDQARANVNGLLAWRGADDGHGPGPRPGQGRRQRPGPAPAGVGPVRRQAVAGALDHARCRPVARRRVGRRAAAAGRAGAAGVRQLD